MWIFTTKGALSIVSFKDDPSKLLVRARDPESIEWFHGEVFPEAGWAAKARKMRSIPQTKVTPDADYRYRFVADREAVAVAISRYILRDLTYPNFKNAAGSAKDRSAYRSPYMDWLHEIWQVGAALFGSYGRGPHRLRRTSDPDLLLSDDDPTYDDAELPDGMPF